MQVIGQGVPAWQQPHVGAASKALMGKKCTANHTQHKQKRANVTQSCTYIVFCKVCVTPTLLAACKDRSAMACIADDQNRSGMTVATVQHMLTTLQVCAVVATVIPLRFFQTFLYGFCRSALDFLYDLITHHTCYQCLTCKRLYNTSVMLQLPSACAAPSTVADRCCH